MKKFFVFIAFVLSFNLLKAQSPNTDLPDTVWTKLIWPAQVQGVMFSPDGNQVYVSTDQQVLILNTLSGEIVKTIKGVGAFKVMSSDNKYIYTTILYKPYGTIYKLDAITFEIIDSMHNDKYNGHQVFDIALTNDNKNIIAAIDNFSFTNKMNYSLWKLNTETMKVEEYKDYTGSFSHVTVSPDSKYFVTDWNNGIYNSKDLTRKLLLWDASTFKVIKEIYSDTFNIDAIKFTPNGEYLCSSIQGIINSYETKNFSAYKKLFLNHDITFTNNLCFSNDSKYVVFSDYNLGKLIIADFNNQKLIYEYLNNDYYGNNNAFSPNQKYIISGGGGGISLVNNKSSFTNIIDNSVVENTLNISPNPTNKNINILFTNRSIGSFEIKVFDNKSNIISNVFTGNLEIGNHNFNFNTNSLPNGVYFCKVIGNNVNLVQKFIVSK